MKIRNVATSWSYFFLFYFIPVNIYIISSYKKFQFSILVLVKYINLELNEMIEVLFYCLFSYRIFNFKMI